jgi:hypothetical protein
MVEILIVPPSDAVTMSVLAAVLYGANASGKVHEPDWLIVRSSSSSQFPGAQSAGNDQSWTRLAVEEEASTLPSGEKARALVRFFLVALVA